MGYAVSLILMAIVVLSGGLAQADNTLKFLYSRNDIAIVRNKIPASLPWLKDSVNPSVMFDVEVRDAENVYNKNIQSGQTGWFNLSSPKANNGVMMMFKTPRFAAIERSTEYAPLDILLVDGNGVINQIVPNIKLFELERDIMPQNPVAAFLFLQGGLAEKLSIAAGDKLDSPLFKKSNLIIDQDKFKVLSPSAGTPAPRPLVQDLSSQLKTLYDTPSEPLKVQRNY